MSERQPTTVDVEEWRETPVALRWWPVARCGIRLVLRRRIFWLFLLIGLANFLFYFAMVYFVANLEATLLERGARLPPFVKGFVFVGSGKSYRDFIFQQNIVVMLFLAFAGSILVSNDFRFHAVGFYLSKPLTRLQYFLGKFVAAAVLAALITLAPALFLFVEYGAFSNSFDYYLESQGIFWAIVGYAALVCAFTAILLLGVCAVFRRILAVISVWGAIYVLMPMVANMLRGFSESDNAWAWGLLDVWSLLRWISNLFFGIDRDVYLERLPWALAVVGGWVLLSLFAFWRRLSSAEVVR